MTKKRNISQEELDIFYEAVKGTKPLLSHDKVRLTNDQKTTKQSIAKRKDYQAKDEEHFNFSEGNRHDPIASDEIILYKHTSITHKVLRKLSKGQYNVEAVLDLHGLTVEKARIAVDTFLKRCLLEKIRVILIIHGKGHHAPMPILKNKLNNWLRETPTILAFCSAAPKHGGLGAMYVLLKNLTEENKA